MKYICIDLETTGLDHKNCQIIEFAAVLRDTKNPIKPEESPSFHCYVKHDVYQGEPYALQLNQRIFQELAKDPGKADAPVYTLSETYLKFYDFLLANGYKASKNTKRIHFVAAGKNFGNFDLNFLRKDPLWDEKFLVSSRILDPAMLWILESDNRVPGLGKCMERAGISGVVTHHALNDVYDTILTLEAGLRRLWDFQKELLDKDTEPEDEGLRNHLG